MTLSGRGPRWSDSVGIGHHILKNRIVVTAHSYGLYDGTEAGVFAMSAYVDARLKGGVGMLIMGETLVGSDSSETGEWGSALSDDRIVDLYNHVSVVAREQGALVLEQLYHPGGQVWHEEATPAYAPSNVPHARSAVLPRSLRDSEVGELVDQFVTAARRASLGGLHGIEIKADQGKLVHQFLSSKYNHRTDSWGGAAVEDRARFLVRILQEVRKNCPELLIGVRLPIMGESGVQAFTNDLPTDEVSRVSEMLTSAKLVDYISLSAATNSSAWGYVQGHPEPRTDVDAYREYAKRIKGRVNIPILVAGAVYDLQGADDLLLSKCADLVGMTRAHIADPAIISKSLAADEPIIPCIASNSGCVGNTWYGRPIRCSVNASTGRESILPILPDLHHARVAVVGAGPAGMQAALRLAEAGATVDLFERSTVPGGQLRVAALLPGRARYSAYLRYLQDRAAALPELSVNFSVEVELNEDFVRQYGRVVVAVGCDAKLPSKLADSSICMTDEAAICSSMNWAGKSVIIADTERVRDALGTAEFLASRGALVLVCTPFDAPGLGLDPVTLVSRLRALAEVGVQTRTWTEIVSVQSGTAVLADHLRDRLDCVANDYVVYVTNGHPRLEREFDALQPFERSQVVRIGDAKWPRGLDLAIREAHDSPYNWKE